MFRKSFMVFDANAAGSGNGNGSTGNGNNAGVEGSTEPTLTFETWSESLPEEQKSLIANHTKSLKGALDSERETRKGLEKQVRDLAKKAEAGSDTQMQLTKLADDLQSADTRATFYEEAHAAGVKNLKLAYTVAVSDEMFDKHGRVNFDTMKKSYPELFASTSTPRGDAGSGTNQTGHGKRNMNDFIRAGAGK